MAQHFPIQFFKQKIFRSIERGIRKRASSVRDGRCPFSDSLKYEEIPREQYPHPRPKFRIFITERSINGYREGFEIHYDDEKKEIVEIFFMK